MKTQGYKIFFLIALLTYMTGYSQVKISGRVTFKNKGISEVNVTLKNTYDGATTDAQGNFSFETSEKGSHTITFTHPKYEEIEKAVNIENQEITLNTDLKEQISEIDAVVVSAGSIEASDRKRATALLTPLDIYTTAGADGQISSALNYLPGVQKVGSLKGFSSEEEQLLNLRSLWTEASLTIIFPIPYRELQEGTSSILHFLKGISFQVVGIQHYTGRLFQGH